MGTNEHEWGGGEWGWEVFGRLDVLGFGGGVEDF